jgi:hypothetical protein
MRRLIRRFTRNGDEGATLILVSLCMTVVCGMAAIAIDGGTLVKENRAQQNAADAAALAAATDCGRGVNCQSTNFTPYVDGGTPAASYNMGASTVTVTMTEQVSYFFARVLGHNQGTVTRSATAKWGTIGVQSTVLPITISGCEFSQALLNGTTDIVVYLDDPKPQSGCSSLPGGFSQLTNNNCVSSLLTNQGPPPAGDIGWYAGDPGGDVKKIVPCITNATGAPLPHDVLVPMYDSNACNAVLNCKGHGPYPIKGYAEFHVTGYSFNGQANDGTLGKNCPDQGQRGKYCIQGDFIRFTSQQGTPGPSTDFGATTVSLTG